MSKRGLIRRTVLAVAGGASVLATLAGLVAVSASATPAPVSPAATTSGPKCAINFTSDSMRPAVGQNITLSWTTSGADQLIASWTTAAVPFVGTQVTTKDSPGPISYQVTGLKGGQYCGGASLNIVFTAAVSSSAPAPSTSASAPTSSAPPVSGTSAPPVTTSSAAFPAQSPTGAAAVPWYEQPVNLAVLGVLCLFASIALFNRQRIRAALVRRH